MDEAGIVIFFLIIVGSIIAIIATLVARANAKERARAAYQDALARLKVDPTNADLRQETLMLGRHYANLTRNRTGVALFDEVALMNDINAACAGAPSLRVEKTSGTSVEERLTSLANLRSKGLIQEHEYLERRTKILNEV